MFRTHGVKLRQNTAVLKGYPPKITSSRYKGGGSQRKDDIGLCGGRWRGLEKDDG